VRRGHDVTLFASGDSDLGAAVALTERAVRLDASSREVLAARHQPHLGRVFGHERDFDFIHCHVDYLAYPFSASSEPDTAHVPRAPSTCPYLARSPRVSPTCGCISISEARASRWRRTASRGRAPSITGCRSRASPFEAQPRVPGVPRPALAREAARGRDRGGQAVGMPLRIAAKIDANDHDYVQASSRRPRLSLISSSARGRRSQGRLPGGGARCCSHRLARAVRPRDDRGDGRGTPVIAGPAASGPSCSRTAARVFWADTARPRRGREAHRHDRPRRGRRQVERRFSVARMVTTTRPSTAARVRLRQAA